ncbi:acyltransferase [Granulicella sp. dw_53]|uniref:acyltransferase family protein n=1 Tax=Granulicella sp. dw_53 TaxID=2719792 RepID=UPI001BD21F3E|nr:acyltransferase [Granulicella sp. dw_53]
MNSSFFSLQYTSILPYFILMALFYFEASIILRTVPFYKRALAQDLADRNHFAQLDGLRGLLAISVFFTHSETFHQMWVTGSWDLPPSKFYSQLAVGPVSMFFLITGYLFWSKAQKGTKEGLVVFFQHRLRRLFPAYLFAVLLVCIVIAFLSNFHRTVSIFSLIRGSIGLLSFNMIPGPALNNLENTSLIYAGVFWSLRVEWMFYIAYPLLALFARTWRRQLLLVLITFGLYILLPIVRGHMHGQHGTLGLGTIQYFIFFLVAFFSFGMVAAFIKKNYRLESLANSMPATLLGIAVIVALFLFVPPTLDWVEGAVLVFPFLLVVYGNSFFGLLLTRPLILLGQVSYSTYVLHGVVLYTINHLLARTINMATISPLGFWLVTALIGTAVVCLSALSYRFFEAPFMKGYGMKKTTIVTAPALGVH